MLDENHISASQLLHYLNTMNENIKFTMETSPEKIPFLDVLIILLKDTLNENKYHVSTDIYHKPTDTFNYFPFGSFAPRHISRNIPYNLGRRIATIVSNPKVRELRFKELTHRLVAKKYPEKLIHDSIIKAKSIDRDTLINKIKFPTENNNVTLVIDHNPRRKDPSQLIKQCCEPLKFTNKILNKKLSMPKVIVAKRQPPNLLRQLSLNLDRDQNITTNSNNFTKCTDSRCLFCQIVIENETYTTKSGYVLKRNFPMTCKTRDLIYLLICEGCLEEYMGETGTQMNLRTNLHRSQIVNENYSKMKVCKHVHTCGNDKFKIFPFYKCFQQ